MSGYGVFSKFYDALNTAAEYDKRTEYIRRLFEKYDRIPTLLLDFACGTGEFCNRFSDGKTEVIGVDPSSDMLGIAASKSKGDVLYLNQDASSLELYGTVDGAICCLDSVNHITDKQELSEAFYKIALYLEKDRLFIFDVNSVYKHTDILANNCFVFEENGVFCSWQNSLCEDGVTVDIDLDFFCENEAGSYTRYSEYFSERAYTDSELSEMLCEAGFEVLAVLGDMSEQPPTEKEERIYYVAKRK